ncbi:MAG: tetratricopeptide repeat protein [Candidatus Latescibacteria bacterium]|nr:tetratricopeptide repeat protein [Candidatus Latescibacterota bacterium]
MNRFRCCTHLMGAFVLLGITVNVLAQSLSSSGFSEQMAVGQELHDQELYVEACEAYERAIALHPKSSPAHVFLGRAQYELDLNREALKSFEKAVKLDSRSVDAHIGVGRANLRLERQRLDAREAFRRAGRIDPENADIEDYLGMTYVSTFGRRREHGIDGRPHFRKAIEIDPQHGQAYFHLGLTYEVSPSKNYREAIPYFFNQLLVSPDHVEALEHLAGCLMRTRRFDEGAAMMDQIAMLPGSEDNAGLQSVRAQMYALALSNVKDFAEAHIMYEEFVDGLGSEEQPLYKDLTFVASVETALLFEEAGEFDKSEMWRKFWAARDPDPSTLVNERLVEHYRRVLYARTNFASAQFPWDQRGAIYVRFGEPDNRQNVAQPFPTKDAKVESIREVNRQLRYTPDERGFTESWVYVPYGIELFFSDRFGNGKFEFPPLTTDPRVNRFHPKTIATELITQQPEGYFYDYGGAPLEFIFDAVTYRGENGDTEVELAYTVPARQLGHVSDGQGERTWFKSFVVLRDQELRRVTETMRNIGPVERPPTEVPKRSAKTVVRTASLSLPAPPGSYRTSVGIRDSISQRIGIYETPLTVWDYSSNDLNLSDIKLALGVTPRSDDGAFVRHGHKIIPNPSRLFQRSQPVFFYYEIYNLPMDSDGRTRYRTDLEISMKEQKMNIVWRILSGFGRLVRKEDEDSRTVLISYDGEGTKSDEYLYTSVDTGDSPSGKYTVQLTITDLLTGQTISRSRDFIIVDDGRRPVIEEESQVEMKALNKSK